tara:strand:- start:1440 stop:1736 length:297 start_codon:yes stop_codon:yes gene_type:complete
MNIIKGFKNNKIFLLNIFLTLYVVINLTGGDRGLFSYLEKKNIQKSLIINKEKLTEELNILVNKNNLLSNKIDLDYLDYLYRKKLKLGNKDEILIKLK